MNFYLAENTYYQNKQKDFTYLRALPPGIYKPDDVASYGNLYTFEPVEQKERLIHFNNGPAGDLLRKIPDFFREETKQGFREMGVGHKMGILLYGPHGTGKTATVRVLMDSLVETYGAICLSVTGAHPGKVVGVLRYLRSVQDNPVVCFFDEFELLCNSYEASLLTFLDGDDSVGTCITIGCTNHIDKIPDRIKDRPSRIKHLIEISALPSEVYQQFIREKLPALSGNLLHELAHKAEEHSLTLDQVKHVLIDYRLERVPFDKSISHLKGNRE